MTGTLRFAQVQFDVPIDLLSGQVRREALRIPSPPPEHLDGEELFLRIELHPAVIEGGQLGSKGVTVETRTRLTEEVVKQTFGAETRMKIMPWPAADPIPSFGEVVSVARVRGEWLAPHTVSRVLYATDRAPGPNAPCPQYTAEERKDLDYGWATVALSGKLVDPETKSGLRAWVAKLFKSEVDTDRPTELLCTMRSKSSEEFTELLGNHLKRAGSDQVLVYVHGFNTTYGGQIRDAAVLGWLLKFPGPVVAYSWASQGRATIEGYDTDYEVASRTADRLSAFLQYLSTSKGVRRIQVVAHSMGSRSLLWALKQLPDKLRRQRLLDQVVMVAPDVARQDFDQYFPRVRNMAARYTVYSTTGDIPLRLSSHLHGGPRVGLSAEASGPYLIEGIEAVDATQAVNDILSHGYHLKSPLLESDIFYVLRSAKEGDRSCVRRDTATGKFLRFRCPH